jgi:hypothetical protein
VANAPGQIAKWFHDSAWKRSQPRRRTTGPLRFEIDHVYATPL